MQYSEFACAIRQLGREVNPDTLHATRKLVTPLVAGIPEADVHILRDVQYGQHQRQRLDVFTPAARAEPARPVLIFVHGGGFVAGDKSTPGSPFYDNIATWAVRHGFNAVNITYRLAPQYQWPSGIDDIHAAVQLLRQRGSEFGLNVDTLFLMGQSAGAAHAAAYVAHQHLYAPYGHGLKGLILLSGLYNFESMRGPLERAYLGEDTALYAERSSLAGLVASDLPLLLTIAENDPALFEQQGLELLVALQRKHGQLPRFVHMLGHNHFSVALYLGLSGDLLAPQLLQFIADYR
jgi:acetyl esterase/lipase